MMPMFSMQRADVRLRPESKLILMISATFAIIASNQPAFLILMLLSLFLALKALKVKISPLVKFLAFAFASVVASQALFYYGYYIKGSGQVLLYIIEPSSPLAWLTMGRGLAVTKEGIVYGVLSALKLSCLTLLSIAFATSTRESEVLYVLEKLAPRRAVILAVAVAKMVPTALEEAWHSYVSLRMKGVNPLRSPILFASSLVRSSSFNILRRAKAFAVALHMKAPKGVIHITPPSRPTVKDALSLAVSVVLLALPVLM